MISDLLVRRRLAAVSNSSPNSSGNFTVSVVMATMYYRTAAMSIPQLTGAATRGVANAIRYYEAL